jgi:ATP-binding cassette subfamily B protein
MAQEASAASAPRGTVLRSVQCWPRALGIIGSAAPRHTALWTILLIVQGNLPVASVYLSKLLVDSLVQAIGTGFDWVSIRPTLILVVLTASVTLSIELIQVLIEWIRTAQSELVQDHVKGLVHAQAASVDFMYYESPEYHDDLERVRNEASTRLLSLLENVGSALQNSITFLAMGAVLVSYGIWVPLALFLSTLPAVYVVVRFGRRYHDWWLQTTTHRRWAQYYDAVLTHQVTAAEVRLFHLGGHFQELYQSIRRRLRDDRLTLTRQQSLAKLGAAFLALLIAGGTSMWMISRAIQGVFSLGDLVLFYQAFTKGQGLMRSLLTSAGQILTGSLFLDNLFAFLRQQRLIAEPSQPVIPPIRLQHGIRFRDVVFRYPGSERPALNSFNLLVPAGSITAIVGPNGAGKSSVLKLLCRFYDPEEGQIELDGIDLRNMSTDDLRHQMTILFQFPAAYAATAAENIALGDLSKRFEMQNIENAARQAGAHDIIKRLPRGYETLLTRVFPEGVELSGGEWQRIAMARAYLRNAPIIVLDEPTSFMDSWAENEWFARFRTLAIGRTAIVITHRFTIALRADMIHVMDSGRIVESGTHQELMRLNGLYARSWNTQMQASMNST